MLGFIVRAPSLAAVHVRLRCLRNMDNRRCPGEVVGLYSCTCAGGAMWATTVSLVHCIAS